jgi:hypothetical protein
MAILLVEQYYDFARSLADQYPVMERGEIIKRGAGRKWRRTGCGSCWRCEEVRLRGERSGRWLKAADDSEQTTDLLTIYQLRHRDIVVWIAF